MKPSCCGKCLKLERERKLKMREGKGKKRMPYKDNRYRIYFQDPLQRIRGDTA